MRIRFLGTNGWFATRTGNTTCAAIALSDRLIVLDAGDGFQKVPALLEKLGLKKADIFLSHLHIDHVAGLHAMPLLRGGTALRIFCHSSYLPKLSHLLSHPYTASPEEQFARVLLLPVLTGENSVPYKVRCLPLRHADPCFGYRFSIEGREIAYCTDTGPCEGISRLAKNADILISECSLLPGAGKLLEWPHLSPEMAAKEAKKAGAKRLILTHFDASKYTNLALRKKAEAAARRIFKNTAAAYDGLSIGV